MLADETMYMMKICDRQNYGKTNISKTGSASDATCKAYKEDGVSGMTLKIWFDLVNTRYTLHGMAYSLPYLLIVFPVVVAIVSYICIICVFLNQRISPTLLAGVYKQECAQSTNIAT